MIMFVTFVGRDPLLLKKKLVTHTSYKVTKLQRKVGEVPSYKVTKLQYNKEYNHDNKL